MKGPDTLSLSNVTGDDLAIVLSGGGARAAYQIGLLRCLAKSMPELRFRIITGVSAGAINAAFLAAHPGGLREAADDLTTLWSGLEPERIFRAGTVSLGRQLTGWAVRLISGGSKIGPRTHGLVDTTPLDELLRHELEDPYREIGGIEKNLDRGHLKAVALTTLNYSTGQTVTWVQGSEIRDWERPSRRSVRTTLTVDHVMASASLPLFFPAIRVGNDWHGDGGVRLAAPLSPALHLGARRILAISTRYDRNTDEADDPSIQGYPPPAQILGHLMNAIFLDVLDQDVARLDRLNALIEKVPEKEPCGLHKVDILALRPSVDLGRLAAEYEPRLPKAFRFLTRGLGTRETKSPDFLSLLMFQPDYLARLIEIGEADAQARRDEIAALVMGDRAAAATPKADPTEHRPPPAEAAH